MYFTYVKSADEDKRDWMSLNVENASDLVTRRIIHISLVQIVVN